jgi:hypothetical protein
MADGERAKQRTYGIRCLAHGMKDNPEKFEVGDRVQFVLKLGKVAEGEVRAVIKNTGGVQLNISFGTGLSAAVNARQVVQKLPLVN